MSKFIVTVFDDEKSAYAGSEALQDLHRNGDISVYAAAVIEKNSEGVVSVKSGADEGPVGTVLGMLTGGMVGVLGGPVGMMAGSTLGAWSGMWYDIWNTGVDGQFLDDVGTALSNGKCAVVAEAEEGWQTPVDTKMEALGGTIHRRMRIDVEDDQCEREAQAYQREFDQLAEERAEAKDDKQIAAVDKKMKSAKSSLKKLKEKATKRIESLKKQVTAKTAKLDLQLAEASDDRKKRIEATRTQLKSDYDNSVAKLEQAGKLIDEAIA